MIQFSEYAHFIFDTLNLFIIQMFFLYHFDSNFMVLIMYVVRQVNITELSTTY